MSSYGNHVWTPERGEAAKQLVQTAVDCDDDGFEKTINEIAATDMTAVAALLAEQLASRVLADHHGDCCANCSIPADEADADDRTPEQYMADVAATTLVRLTHIADEYEDLHRQLDGLADWAGDHDLDEPAGYLEDFAAFARITAGLLDAVSDAVRDVAATLPIRGLDYGTGKKPEND